ncbi:hypothetical protein GCM10010911_53170 [Paenibacillus nasutitermitis]|uniref:NodB homology domain-containing protein n=1 Tax=Paenibacillus nasutitermitis TaxID=1652958 RepID=A0A917E1A4_9BACL|nr:hypothetical protein GCM10010911_53170 [Paenibacillus nasutitermitis]
MLLVIAAAILLFVGSYNTQSAWDLWADDNIIGSAEGVEALSGGSAPGDSPREGQNIASAAGAEENGDLNLSGKVEKQPAGTGGQTGQKQDKGGNSTLKLDKPTSPVVQYEAKAGSKLVALTFDDGPDTSYTPAILDILKQYNAKATFFTVGTQIKKYPDMMKRIVKEGHEIGNHTYHHKDLSKLDSDHIANEIMWTDTLIQQAVGYVPRLVRAPYGATNSTLNEMIGANGRDLVGWTVDTRDWAGESAASIKANVNKNTKPGGIILMHSFGSKHIKNTVSALPGVIKELQKKGYTFVTVDELLAAKKH